MSGWFLACQKWCHLSLFLPPFPRIRIRFPSSLSCYTRRFYHRWCHEAQCSSEILYSLGCCCGLPSRRRSKHAQGPSGPAVGHASGLLCVRWFPIYLHLSSRALHVWWWWCVGLHRAARALRHPVSGTWLGSDSAWGAAWYRCQGGSMRRWSSSCQSVQE